MDSLSPSEGERVRVRGNVANYHPAYRTTPGTVDPGESSGAAGLDAGEIWQSPGVFGVETLLLPRTAALRTLKTYKPELSQNDYAIPSPFRIEDQPSHLRGWTSRVGRCRLRTILRPGPLLRTSLSCRLSHIRAAASMPQN